MKHTDMDGTKRLVEKEVQIKKNKKIVYKYIRIKKIYKYIYIRCL